MGGSYLSGIRAIVCVSSMFLLRDKFGIHSIPLGYALGEGVRWLFFAAVIVKNKILPLKLDFHLDPAFLGLFQDTFISISEVWP